MQEFVLMKHNVARFYMQILFDIHTFNIKLPVMSNFYQAIRFCSGLILLIVSPLFLPAQAPTISYVAEISTGLAAPVDIVNAGDGTNRLFIVQQEGIVVVKNGSTVTEFGNFGASGANIISTGGERGLLSLAFHPGYDGVNNRYFFIYFTDLSGNIAVSRFQTTAGNINTADLSTGVNIITIPHPGESNHNGGKLNFGNDGYLYFATGDGGGGNDAPNNAQTGTSLLGKMLRIDINTPSVTYGNYSVPPDNPYVSDAQIDDRIWALGLRNPFRWSFDRLTGDMWIGDVGQGAFEEINFRAAGSTGHVNYGWRCFEGYESTPGVADCLPVDYVKPVYDYPNPLSGSSAVTGGFVYRGSEFPNFRGYYIAADVYSGDVFLLWPNGNGGFDSSAQVALPVNLIVTFGEGEDGTLYAASQGTNVVYKVVATGGSPLPVSLERFAGTADEGYNELSWSTAAELNTARFYVESSSTGASFTRVGTVSATRNPNGSDYNFRHYINNSGDIFYRLAIEDDNGRVAWSSIIRLNGNRKNKIRIYPTVISNGTVTLEVNNLPLRSIKIVSTSGVVVYKNEIRNNINTINLKLPALSRGVYVIELTGDNGLKQTEKIVVQ